MQILVIDAGKTATYGQTRTLAALRTRGADPVLVHPDEIGYSFSKDASSLLIRGEEASLPDVCWIRRTRAAVSQVVEAVAYLTHAGVPCIDPLESYASPLNKTFTLMRAAGQAAIPESLVLSADQTQAIPEWNHFPAIVKPLDGSSGKGITVAQDHEELEVQVEHLRGSGRRPLIQRRIEIDEEYRVVIVGSEVVGVCRKRAQPGAVTRNASTGAVFELVDKPTLHEKARLAARRVHTHICGVDLAETREGVFLFEANRCPDIEPTERAGLNIAERIADYLLNVS